MNVKPRIGPTASRLRSGLPLSARTLANAHMHCRAFDGRTFGAPRFAPVTRSIRLAKTEKTSNDRTCELHGCFGTAAHVPR